MSKIQIFESTDFGTVRTVLIDKEPYFVGKDVCEAFDDKNHNRSLGRIDEEDKRREQITDVLGRKQEAVLINESGLYALLFAMQPQKANHDGVSDAYPIEVQERIKKLRRFKRWVTSEVLPAIRKTGSYTVPKLEKNPKYRTRMVGTAVRDIRSTAAELQKLFGLKSGIALAKATNMIERAYGVDMEEVKELIPPAEHETGFLNATQIGALLGVNARRANELLQLAGLQVRFNGTWRLTSKGKEHGEEMPYERNGHSGYQIRWSESAVSVVEDDMTA
jgi:phage antirepressor protein